MRDHEILMAMMDDIKAMSGDELKLALIKHQNGPIYKAIHCNGDSLYEAKNEHLTIKRPK